MLTFLRKFRRSLIESGSARKPASPFGRYFLYATGEIALVVIGILIALQINNWNENRKARSFEVKMLSEIRKSLSKDTAYFQMLTRRATWIDTSTETIINLLIDDVNNDSLFLHHMRNIDHTYTFIYQDGAYQALKASGIENISSDTLRNHLINHYGFRMPRYLKLMNFYRKDSDLKLVEDLEWNLFSFEPEMKNGEPVISSVKLKQDVIGSEKFKRYIMIKQREAKWSLQWLEILINETEWLLKALNDELANSEL